jgi:hypothetical protein
MRNSGATQANNYWFLSFNANITNTTDATFAIYLDLDNLVGSGGITPPERDYSVTTVPEHQPEYVIYVDMARGVINSANTWVFTWNGTSWGYGQRFVDIGGAVYNTEDYIELKIPNGVIGMNQDTSSASIMLFSVNISDGMMQDTVPSDPQVPGNATLSRFTTVSERLNLVYPLSAVTGDSSTLPSLLPFYWDWPTGSNASTPFAGNVLQVDLDKEYTPPHEGNIQITSNTSHLSENNVSLLSDLAGDHLYYWRVQPRYWLPGFQPVFGAWTEGWSFRRIGLIPQNLHTSISFGTPTFNWDMAEGAQTYRLQVATDPNFGSIVIDIATPINSFTPIDALNQGQYYWRVQINRYADVSNDWSAVQQLTLSLPTPTGLMPDQTVIQYAPTLCWDPLVGYDNGEPVFTAWKYHVQVSNVADFTLIYDQADTFSNCWTPTMGYSDGKFYWRVALLDGNDHQGYYSPSATFIKQYPVTTLISPISESVPTTPTFIWTPVDGAGTYVFETSQSPSFFPIKESIETINTQYTPTIRYENDKRYYWRVAIRDQSGNQGPFANANFVIGFDNFLFLPLLFR